jgi:hypothetical protein
LPDDAGVQALLRQLESIQRNVHALKTEWRREGR